MPARAYAPEVRPQILTRIAAGEILMHVCAEPGMPCYGSLYAWARADAAFATDLAAARRRGQFRRKWRLDEAKAAALLARLGAGEGIVSILRDPAMPSRRQYQYWRANQAPFQEAVNRINEAKAQARAQRGRDRWRAFDQALADRIVARVAAAGGPLQKVLSADPDLPGRQVVIRWRKANPDFDQGLRIAFRIGRLQALAKAECSAELTEAVTNAIRDGATLSRVGQMPGMPCRTTLYTWMRKRPAFAAEVACALADRQDWYVDRMLMIAEGPDDLRRQRHQIGLLKARLRRLQDRIERMAPG